MFTCLTYRRVLGTYVNKGKAVSCKMSDLGTDNPAFSNADECLDSNTSKNLENSHTESVQQEHKDKSSVISNGNSFVSQHYVEPNQNNSDVQYKTETRIEVPGEEEKTSNTAKTNGVNGNSNNNDVSFLNTSVTSAQINGKIFYIFESFFLCV